MNKKLYWISTGLLCLTMLLSAASYLFLYNRVSEIFTAFGYPTFIIYPLAIAKFLGVVAILSRKSEMLKEWAYAGFFFDFMIALLTHINVGDGASWMPIVALLLLFVSYKNQGSI